MYPSDSHLMFLNTFFHGFVYLYIILCIFILHCLKKFKKSAFVQIFVAEPSCLNQLKRFCIIFAPKYFIQPGRPTQCSLCYKVEYVCNEIVDLGYTYICNNDEIIVFLLLLLRMQSSLSVFITDHNNPYSDPTLTESFSQLFGNSSAGHGVTLEYY